MSIDCSHAQMVSEHWPQTKAQRRLMFSCSGLVCFTYSLTCSLKIAAMRGGIGSPMGAVGVGMVGRVCRILGLTTFNSLPQYVNWLVMRFVLSTIVNQNKEAWLQESKLAKMLWTSRREFGTNRWEFLPKVKHFIF